VVVGFLAAGDSAEELAQQYLRRIDLVVKPEPLVPRDSMAGQANHAERIAPRELV
jgi:hypothetical protein